MRAPPRSIVGVVGATWHGRDDISRIRCDIDLGRVGIVLVPFVVFRRGGVVFVAASVLFVVALEPALAVCVVVCVAVPLDVRLDVPGRVGAVLGSCVDVRHRVVATNGPVVASPPFVAFGRVCLSLPPLFAI